MTMKNLIMNSKDGRTAIYNMDEILSVDFGMTQFDKKRKEPSIIIVFKDGSSATFIAANWYITFEK
jgi:hypothetical protein